MAYLKFSGSLESVFIFTELGMEPEGRILVGCLEVVASLFLMTKSFSQYGAFLSLAIMLGAMIAHATVLGWEVNGDGGRRLLLWTVNTICISYIMYIDRMRIPLIGKIFDEPKEIKEKK